MSSAAPGSWGRVLRRYAAFQLPEIVLGGIVIYVLVQAEVLSRVLGWLFFALWLAKEVVLFPFVRHSYEPSEPAPARPLVGRTAEVTRPLVGPGTGYVRVGSELWSARLAPGCSSAEVGDEVQVERVEGLTLVVAPTPVREP